MSGKRILQCLLLGSFLFVSPAAWTQDTAELERKVEVLERQLRAVQRRVFQGGELPPEDPVQQRPAAGATDALAVLTTRLGRIEREMRDLTGRLEEMEHRQRMMEDRLIAMETASARRPSGSSANDMADANRSDRQIGNSMPATSVPEPVADTTPTPPAIQLPEGTDRAKYNYAFSFVRSNDNASAEMALRMFIDEASDEDLKTNARYWLGKVYGIGDQPGRAAEQFLHIFQNSPDHDKAPESLVELAGALVKLENVSDACDVLGEFDRAYPDANNRVKRQANAVRLRANCN